MFVSLGNITPPVTDLNTIAGWLLGTVVVLVVAGIFVGLWAWITGKSFNVSDWAMKGKVTLGLCVIAAMLLGSLVPGITWASKNEWTLALLPDGAGKRDIRVDTKRQRRNARRESASQPTTIEKPRTREMPSRIRRCLCRPMKRHMRCIR
jgi:hypothetical protein